LTRPAAAEGTQFRRREANSLQHVGKRAGIEHLFVMRAGVHHVSTLVIRRSRETNLCEAMGAAVSAR